MNLSRMQQALAMGFPIEVAVDAHLVWKGGDKQKTSSSSTSESQTDSSSTNTSTPNQSSQYGNLLNQSDSWLANGGINPAYMNQSATIANMSAGQQGSLYDSVNNGKELNGIYTTAGREALWQMLGNYDPKNTGLTSAVNASNSALDYNYNTTVAPQVQQGAIDTGQYGSTRNGVAQGIALSNLSQQKVNAGSQLAYQDQQAFNSNRLAAYQSLGQITSGINSGNSLTNAAYEQDRGLQQQTIDKNAEYDMQKWAYENNVDYNTLAAYKNLISGDMGGTVNGVGSSNSTGSSTSKGTTSGGGGGGALGTIGMIGGAVVGGIYGGPMGASAGASVGGGIGNSFG